MDKLIIMVLIIGLWTTFICSVVCYIPDKDVLKKKINVMDPDEKFLEYTMWGLLIILVGFALWLVII